MTLKKNSSESAGPKLEKIVSQLKEPAKRTKQVLQNAFEKSISRFQDIASKSDSEKTRTVTLRKIEKISSNLEILKVLSEDEIIRYALLKINKIIPIASNPRFPQEERMKARVAAHKPLSTHLARLKQKQIESHDTSSESEDEQGTTSSSTLNKITFNNIVVSMRKDVKRAKVFVIHKLTRTIKKLRLAKGKEEKVAKFLRKAERLHKKVIHIKELHEDEISKFALSTTQNLSQLATDIKAPTASQALAVMAVHEFVAAHVRDFKTKYPDWQKVVPNLLKKKNKKRKLSLETKDKKNLSEFSQASGEADNNTSESEKIENDYKSENDQSENEHDHSESENYSSESEHENEKGNESYSESENENSENDSETNNSDLDSGSRNTLLKNHEADDSEVSRNKQNKVKSDRHISTKNYKKNKLSEDSEMFSKTAKKIISKGEKEIEEMFSKTAKKIISKGEKEIEEKSSSLEVPSSPAKNKPKVIDPFFVTTTNEEYVTSQVPPSNEITSSNENNKSFKTYRTRKPDSFDFKNSWERRGEERNYGKLSRFKESAPFEKHSAHSFNRDNVGTRTDRIVFGNRKERRKALLQPKVEEKVEQLHPSWEAKRKQSNIKPFQGKKVKFD